METDPKDEPQDLEFRHIWADGQNIGNLLSEVGPPRRPDFLCVGTEKAGTTWLWHCMKQHANIGVPATKELRMFNESKTFDLNHFRAAKQFFENPRAAPLRPDFLERVATELRLLQGGIPAYLRVFGQLDAPVVGELTPQYCIQSYERVAQMRAVAPDARIIYMLRDPVERLVSGARMVLRAQKIEPSDAALLKEARHPIQLRFCNGHAHIDKFAKVYGEDKLGVFFYDDIARRPADLLDEICDFVGAERATIDPKFLSQTVNKGTSYRPSREVYAKLYAKLSPVYDALEQMFPAQVNQWRAKHE
ncbi:MAG: sulfotransferase [Paracoccaceae bacterium]